MLCTCAENRVFFFPLRGTWVVPRAAEPHVCKDAPSSPRDLGAQLLDSGVGLVPESPWLFQKSQAGAISSSSPEGSSTRFNFPALLMAQSEKFMSPPCV